VNDLAKCVKESHRIIKPNGYSIHAIGPLYYTYGGDHCISAFGAQHGFNHLIKDKEAYRSMVFDDEFFKNTDDPNQAWWAKHGIFSYARVSEYLNIFRKTFSTVFVSATLSPEAILFKKRHPQDWSSLLSKQLSETDLMTKSLTFICKK